MNFEDNNTTNEDKTDDSITVTNTRDAVPKQHFTAHEAPVAQINQSEPNSAAQQQSKKPMLAIVAVLILILMTIGIWGIAVAVNNKPKAVASFNEDTQVKSNEFQALFLTNGQVYFGKLTNLDNKYVSMTDIYYLQVQGSGVQPAGSDTSSQSTVSLAKLGNELHGPEDKMNVSSTQVLFWENLKNDSKVVQAINAYQTKK